MTARKQLSREEIHALRGKYKFDNGGKSFAEWMADWKREEKELDEKKFEKMDTTGKR